MLLGCGVLFIWFAVCQEAFCPFVTQIFYATSCRAEAENSRLRREVKGLEALAVRLLAQDKQRQHA